MILPSEERIKWRRLLIAGVLTHLGDALYRREIRNKYENWRDFAAPFFGRVIADVAGFEARKALMNQLAESIVNELTG